MLNATELMVNEAVNNPPASRFGRAEPVGFDELVSHHGRITNIVSSRLGFSDEADDLVQEIFLSAMKNLKGFRGESRLSGWLGQIAVNRCHSHWRKVSAQRKMLAGVAKVVDQTALPEPETVVMERETFFRVRRVVQALPGHYREVVVLRYFKQIPTGDMAVVLDIPAASVRSRLHRARRRLRYLLPDLVD